MELAIGLMSAAGAATETLGTAATALLGGSAPINLVAGTAAETASAGLGSTALSVLQNAAGLGGMFSAIAQGATSAQSYKTQAALADAEAGQEQLAGLQRTTAMKRELAKAVGQSDVVYAAGGTDIGGGIAVDARQAAKSRASTEISVDRSMTEARMALQRSKAAGYRRLASGAELSGWVGAATTGAKTAFDLYQRG